MNCAIYARVSKEKCNACGHLKTEHKGGQARCQAKSCDCIRYQGQDPENQLAQLRVYAKAQGWVIVEYVDYETGKHSDRDALQRMFQDASRRQFGVVLVWALDRLSREGALATLVHLKRLKDYGVQFESFSEPQFRTTGPFGEVFTELFVSLSACFAKMERIRISDRTKAGLERARRRGRFGGRPAKVFDRQRARELRNQKPPVSWRAIAKLMGIAQSTIRKALEPAKKGVHKRSSGKPAKRVPSKG